MTDKPELIEDAALDTAAGAGDSHSKWIELMSFSTTPVRNLSKANPLDKAAKTK